MKIALATNIFGDFHRQTMCIESLKRIKSEYSDIVDLYNLQSPDNLREEDNFETLPCLTRTSKDLVPNSKKTKPLIKDMFNGIGKLPGYDYFIFTNSDIILSNRFIKTILESPEKDSFSGARLTIENINTLDETPTLVQYQVAGFDTFAVKREWWKLHNEKFPEYIYAEPCWDVHYATLFKRFGNSMFVNKWPAALFHIHHEIAWAEMTPERQHNENMLFRKYKSDSDMWHKFLFSVLLKRTPAKGFYNPLPNEEKLENIYFPRGLQ